MSSTAPSAKRMSQQPYIPEFFSPTFTPTARFNPKRVTEEAEAARNAPPRPVPTGPFFNATAPARKRAAHSRSPVSKTLVKLARYANLLLRVGQLLGAMGLLVCMLLVRGVDDISGWICRVPVR